MCADAGLSIDAVAQALRVTRRTVQYWFSGRVQVPYAAYRLVRILGRYELPDPAWRGWIMHSGKLWSPEGHGFVPADSNWWGLLVRQAAAFRRVYDRQRVFEALMLRTGRAAADAAGSGLARPGPGGADRPAGDAGRQPQAAGPHARVVTPHVSLIFETSRPSGSPPMSHAKAPSKGVSGAPPGPPSALPIPPPLPRGYGGCGPHGDPELELLPRYDAGHPARSPQAPDARPDQLSSSACERKDFQ
jgi:hypothetical protein